MRDLHGDGDLHQPYDLRDRSLGYSLVVFEGIDVSEWRVTGNAQRLRRADLLRQLTQRLVWVQHKLTTELGADERGRLLRIERRLLDLYEIWSKGELYEPDPDPEEAPNYWPV